MEEVTAVSSMGIAALKEISEEMSLNSDKQADIRYLPATVAGFGAIMLS